MGNVTRDAFAIIQAEGGRYSIDESIRRMPHIDAQMRKQRGIDFTKVGRSGNRLVKRIARRAVRRQPTGTMRFDMAGDTQESLVYREADASRSPGLDRGVHLASGAASAHRYDAI